MMTSSTVVPVDVSSSDTSTEVKQEESRTGTRPFEDSNGDLPVDSKKEDISTDTANAESGSSSESKVDPGTGSDAGKAQEGSYDKKDEAMKDESKDTSETGTYSDANGKLGGVTAKDDGEVAKEGGGLEPDGNKQTGGEEENRHKGTDKNSVETTDTEQEKSRGRTSDISEDSQQGKSNEQKDDEEQNFDRTAEPKKEKNTEPISDQTENSDQDGSTLETTDKTSSNEQQQSDDQKNQQQSDDQKTSGEDGKIDQDKESRGETLEKTEPNEDITAQNSDEKKPAGQAQGSNELLPSGAQLELLNETNTQNGAWSTQASESKNEKEVQLSSSPKEQASNDSWKLCTAGPDYIPCLDNEEAIKKLHSTKHYEHRERHCPDEGPTCLVPLPDGYKKSIEWPNSRDKVRSF